MCHLLFVRSSLCIFTLAHLVPLSIIGVTDNTLPRKPCRTCKNRFHASCLYKVRSAFPKSAPTGLIVVKTVVQHQPLIQLSVMSFRNSLSVSVIRKA